MQLLRHTLDRPLKLASEELGTPVAEAPVFIGVLDDGDHHVARARATPALQLLADELVERDLLLTGSRAASHLDDHNVP